MRRDGLPLNRDQLKPAQGRAAVHAGRGPSDSIQQALCASFAAADRSLIPFEHWDLTSVLPEEIARATINLPFQPPPVAAGSGRRELYNGQRSYFAGEVLDAHPVCRRIAEAFQSPAVVSAVMSLTGALLIGTFLRIEYGADLDGFWLEPHTDLGVKAFTLLLQLADGPDQAGLGTDLYIDGDTWSTRAAFGWNAALVFRPSSHTWHGFERRPIIGVRRSIIVNYVTREWLSREQLAFPETPVA